MHTVPKENVPVRLEHCNMVGAITNQTQSGEEFWSISLDRGLYIKIFARDQLRSVSLPVFFDKKITFEGRDSGFLVVIRHAERRVNEKGEEYYFILNVGIFEPDANVSFQSDDFEKPQ